MLTASEEHRPQPETLSEGAAVLKLRLMLKENSNTAAQSELFHLKRGVFRNSHLS